MNITDALKNLYVAFDGDADDVANMTSIIDVLNAISAKFDGDESSTTIVDSITNITAVADNIKEWTIVNLEVTPTTSEQTFTAPFPEAVGYSPIVVKAVTAAIDANIKAENIKTGITILGVTGTYDGT